MSCEKLESIKAGAKVGDRCLVCSVDIYHTGGFDAGDGYVVCTGLPCLRRMATGGAARRIDALLDEARDAFFAEHDARLARTARAVEILRDQVTA